MCIAEFGGIFVSASLVTSSSGSGADIFHYSEMKLSLGVISATTLPVGTVSLCELYYGKCLHGGETCCCDVHPASEQ